MWASLRASRLSSGQETGAEATHILARRTGDWGLSPERPLLPSVTFSGQSWVRVTSGPALGLAGRKR